MIGIVGGVGPLAGVDLFTKIIEETIVERDQEHVPVVLLSVPGTIPDRTEYLMGREPRNPALGIGTVLLQLGKMGARVAGIPCNTAHAPAIFNIVKQILRQSDSQLELLNMIELTADHLFEYYKGARVGILTTLGTYHAGVYRHTLTRKKIDVIELETAEMRNGVHNAIYDAGYGIKANPVQVSRKAEIILHDAAGELIKRGADIIVSGCSEISFTLTPRNFGNVKLIDPTRLLALALVKAIDPGKCRKAPSQPVARL
ncbi:aspartate racemase [Chitinophaga eiseniae]|uniref:Aspartate racemase n=1 Tax=Chitinophaga eiseniae TaxID=634771 RepID=A0A1T4U6J3_9BACT|nr:amino acid racemase [Chitinophaga eiseniae]SKA48303.1 aspartate racemase [Chitinophaga eiseniae]